MRWIVIALALAGCQVAPSETAVQAIGQDDYCQAAPAPIVPWKPGDPLPPSSANTVVVATEIDKGLYGAYGADPVDGKILWGVHLKQKELGQLITAAASANRPYGGARGPISCLPRCGDPDPGYVLAFARRTLDAADLADADYASCGK